MQFLKILLILGLFIASLLISSSVLAIELVVEKIGEGSYALGWTAVGDDGDSGTAAEYDLRISNGPITEDNFYVATRVLNTPIPSIAGTKEHLLMELNTGEYYLCIKVGDEIPNWSPVSNVFKLVVGVFPPINVLWNQ